MVTCVSLLQQPLLCSSLYTCTPYTASEPLVVGTKKYPISMSQSYSHFPGHLGISWLLVCFAPFAVCDKQESICFTLLHALADQTFFAWQGFYGPNNGQHQAHLKLPDAHNRPGESRIARLHAEVGRSAALSFFKKMHAIEG